MIGAKGITEQRHCEKHGTYTAALTFKGEHGEYWTPCKQCAEEEQRERERRAAEQKRIEAAEIETRRRAKLIQDLGIPPRFRHKAQRLDSFRTDTPGRRVAREQAERILQNDGEVMSLVLSGLVGTGKTHLQCALLHQYASMGWSALYVTQRDMIRMIRDTWRGESHHTESQVLDRLIYDIDMLGIDEVGAGFGSDAERVQFFEIVDGRYREEQATILVTNLTQKELAKYVGERVYDRLKEDGIWVSFNWPSARGGRT